MLFELEIPEIKNGHLFERRVELRPCKKGEWYYHRSDCQVKRAKFDFWFDVFVFTPKPRYRPFRHGSEAAPVLLKAGVKLTDGDPEATDEDQTMFVFAVTEDDVRLYDYRTIATLDDCTRLSFTKLFENYRLWPSGEPVGVRLPEGEEGSE